MIRKRVVESALFCYYFKPKNKQANINNLGPDYYTKSGPFPFKEFSDIKYFESVDTATLDPIYADVKSAFKLTDGDFCAISDGNSVYYGYIRGSKFEHKTSITISKSP